MSKYKPGWPKAMQPRPWPGQPTCVICGQPIKAGGMYLAMKARTKTNHVHPLCYEKEANG